MSPISPIVDMMTEIHYMLQCNLVMLGVIVALLLGSCWRPKQ